MIQQIILMGNKTVKNVSAESISGYSQAGAYYAAFANGSIWVTNLTANVITKINPETLAINNYPAGDVVGTHPSITGICTDGNHLFVACQISNSGIRKYDFNGDFITMFGITQGTSQLIFAEGFLFATSSAGNKVYKLSIAGSILATYDTGSSTGPFCLFYDNGYIYITMTSTNRIIKLTTALDLVATFTPSRIVWGIVILDNSLFACGLNGYFAELNKITGDVINDFSGGSDNYVFLTYHPSVFFLLSDSSANKLKITTINGVAMAEQATPANPIGHTVDVQGRIYVACYTGGTVIRVTML
jgi:sugar lactone lactonase YvrE